MFEEALEVMNAGSMIGQAIAFLIGGTVLAGLTSAALPSVHNLLLLPPPAEQPLWSFLPFTRIAADGRTVVCKDRYLRVIEMEGAEITLASDSAHDLLFEARKRLLDELERFGLEHVKFLTLKQRVRLTRTMGAANPVVRAMDEAWETGFAAPTRMAHYLVLVAKGRSVAEVSAPLDQAEAFALSTLQDYRPRVMQEPDRLEDADFDGTGERPHGPLKPFAQVLSPLTQHSPPGRGYKGPLSALLTADDIDFSRAAEDGLVVFGHRDERRYAALMTWRDCGDRTSEAVVREMTGLDCELVIYHAVQPINTARATLDLARTARRRRPRTCRPTPQRRTTR